jgi:DNA topoisomerase I
LNADRKQPTNDQEAGALDSLAAAKLARLHYSLDDKPGITRHKGPRCEARIGFDYRRPDGSLVRDIETLRHIRSLAIPPAWGAVWINSDPLGHVQATGRDQRGRKQYRYHRRWREVRDDSKYGKMLTFARVLPLIRARADADLRRHGLPRERVLAAIVRLLEQTLFRVGIAAAPCSPQPRRGTFPVRHV